MFRAEVEELDRERAAALGDSGTSKTWAVTEEQSAESILRARGAKGVGADQVPSEFLQAAPSQAAVMLLPLFQKINDRVRLPSQWRGCIEVEVPTTGPR